MQHAHRYLKYPVDSKKEISIPLQSISRVQGLQEINP
jgi:hypothetical protein